MLHQQLSCCELLTEVLREDSLQLITTNDNKWSVGMKKEMQAAIAMLTQVGVLTAPDATDSGVKKIAKLAIRYVAIAACGLVVLDSTPDPAVGQ